METFNRVHSSIRNVIEPSFGLLKIKWQILYNMPSYPMYKQKMIVVATMVLHNFIREHGGEDEDFVGFDRDPIFTPTIPERYNKYIVSSLASDRSTSAIYALRLQMYFVMSWPPHFLLLGTSQQSLFSHFACELANYLCKRNIILVLQSTFVCSDRW
jgi:hypothetical protein